MADEKSGPPNKRKRPPTTIDLKATEVAAEAAALLREAGAGRISVAVRPDEASLLALIPE